MKALMRTLVVALGLMPGFGAGLRAGEPAQPRAWWKEAFPGEPVAQADTKKLERIAVKGNRFVDGHGQPLLLRGVSIADPDKIVGQGHWNKAHFAAVKDFGATLVRIPVHPVAWRERGVVNYLALLDQAVAWCTELNMHVIIDWHSIGNLKAGLYQNPMYTTSMDETAQFWRTIARHFAGHHTVAFYELFNEPTNFNGQLGRVSWDDWKKINEDLIGIVRGYDREVVPLVAGFDWAYDLSPLRLNPVDAEGIGYVTHPYPHKRMAPFEPKWEENFGFASGSFPIIATEIGFTLGKYGMAENGAYGKAIVDYLEHRGISWVAWVFDPEWDPMLIQSYRYELTECGEFFSKAMKAPAK